MSNMPMLSGYLLLLSSACTAKGDGRGHPLYASTPQPLARGEVALLGGYVGEVDGQDVSQIAGPFELLPGCHFVRTRTEWGSGGDNGAVVANTGAVPFALPMRAGYSYSIEVQTGVVTGPTGSLVIQAIETDAGGNPTQVLGPASSQADLEACKAMDSELAGPSGS